jgi:uncharacterized glyoxalase superfamily protein PhnB
VIILKPISLEDVVHYKAIRLRALLDTPSAFGSTYAKESQLTDADWQRRVGQWNGDRSICFLAWDGDQPCGIAAGAPDEANPLQVYLLSMWVAPTHRRRGMGRMLVNAIFDWAKEKKFSALCLDVTCNNQAAIRFYEQLGFTKTGVTKPYPNDPDLWEFEMTRAIASTDFTTRITATLAVRDWPAAMKFYKAAFGAVETYSVPGGGVGQLSIHGADFWVAEESPQHENFSPESLGGCSVRMLLMVENPAAILAQAVAAGAKEIYPVSEAHGWQIGRIVDPFGHHWEIARQLS